jgi:hypothetical protein
VLIVSVTILLALILVKLSSPLFILMRFSAQEKASFFRMVNLLFNLTHLLPLLLLLPRSHSSCSLLLACSRRQILLAMPVLSERGLACRLKRLAPLRSPSEPVASLATRPRHHLKV